MVFKLCVNGIIFYDIYKICGHPPVNLYQFISIGNGIIKTLKEYIQGDLVFVFL